MILEKPKAISARHSQAHTEASTKTTYLTYHTINKCTSAFPSHNSRASSFTLKQFSLATTALQNTQTFRLPDVQNFLDLGERHKNNMLERCRRPCVAMGTLENSNNFMPFPRNLQLNRRERVSWKISCHCFLSFLFFYLLLYRKATEKSCYSTT